MVPDTLQSGSLDQLKDLSGLEDWGTFFLILAFTGALPFRRLGGGGGPGGGGGAIGGAIGGGGIADFIVKEFFSSGRRPSVSDSLCFSSLCLANSVSSFSFVL
jgi:hypothetical protein